MKLKKPTPFIVWLALGLAMHVSIRAIIYFSTLDDPKGIARFILELYYLCLLALVTIAVLLARLSPRTLVYSFALFGTTLFIEWSVKSVGYLMEHHGNLNMFHFIAFGGSAFFFVLLFKLQEAFSEGG